jgi:hypothetical protein
MIFITIDQKLANSQNFCRNLWGTVETRLTTFCRSQNRTKKHKGPPNDIYKKMISQFCKQYTYLTNLKVYLVSDFSSFNNSLLFFTESQKKEQFKSLSTFTHISALRFCVNNSVKKIKSFRTCNIQSKVLIAWDLHNLWTLIWKFYD